MTTFMRALEDLFEKIGFSQGAVEVVAFIDHDSRRSQDAITLRHFRKVVHVYHIRCNGISLKSQYAQTARIFSARSL